MLGYFGEGEKKNGQNENGDLEDYLTFIEGIKKITSGQTGK